MLLAAIITRTTPSLAGEWCRVIAQVATERSPLIILSSSKDSVDMYDLVEKARVFSLAAHSAIGNRRKGSGLPYFTHPQDVYNLISSVTAYVPLQAAAYLHDMEDTKVSLEIIKSEFGEEVAALVQMVSNVAKGEDGNRKVRGLINLEHKAKATPDGQTLVIADTISNITNIVDNEPDFAQVYLAEKFDVIKRLDKADNELREIAMDVLTREGARIGIQFKFV